MTMIRFFYTLALLVYTPLLIFAQEALKPKPSPLAAITSRYKDTYVKVVYSQPHKNGRDIFGKLVPYGKVWRTGANEATEITLTKNIQMNGNLLKAGTYSVFTIPEETKWTIIINSDVGLWGAYNYNSKQDIVRFEIPVQSTAGVVYEPFTMQFDQKNDVADLLIMWDKTKISIPLKFLNN